MVVVLVVEFAGVVAFAAAVEGTRAGTGGRASESPAEEENVRGGDRSSSNVSAVSSPVGNAERSGAVGEEVVVVVDVVVEVLGSSNTSLIRGTTPSSDPTFSFAFSPTRPHSLDI